ncbi:LL-diaminopimelate aminotransferase [Chlamydia sp. 17-3921]|uniref:LL-diaminopimelate aminotransferase n=1 Tax=Chlamydia sp. 17-3921 TaxID=2675798 RepID=UPI001918105B|nr:LL-diaminopimelate aminotransferase [Chlamydia sp. 17-3921]
MERNPYFSNLSPHYFFSGINNKLRCFCKENPEIEIADLSVGNTSYPINSCISSAIENSIKKQSFFKSYQGYGPEAGLPILREKISTLIYKGIISSEEITITDGAKNDIFRLFSLFGPGKTLALQDPTYPAYLDIARLTGIKKIITLPSTKETQFIPELPKNHAIDILCLCFPNNPTGVMATHEELQAFVDYAQVHNAVILFDAAYSTFITDPQLPKSIFEIPGAKSCAIEVGSFSKPLGFTGMRLGWSVVPKELCYNDGQPILPDWQRLVSTVFNGASLPIQEGGYVGLDFFSSSEAISHYQRQSLQLCKALSKAGFHIYGGKHAPYIWVEIPKGISDDEVFDFFLNQYHIAVTPGYAFGNYGKGFIRLSALAKPQDIAKACQQLTLTSFSANMVLS